MQRHPKESTDFYTLILLAMILFASLAWKTASAQSRRMFLRETDRCTVASTTFIKDLVASNVCRSPMSQVLRDPNGEEYAVTQLDCVDELTGRRIYTFYSTFAACHATLFRGA